MKKFKFKKEDLPELPKILSKGDTRLEKMFMKGLKKMCIWLMLASLLLILFNLMINETHNEIVEAKDNEKYQLEQRIKELEADKDIQALEHLKDKELKVKAMVMYLEELQANGILYKIPKLLVELCDIKYINPFRPMAIILLETRQPGIGYGHSEAILYKNNVCGMNWTDEQKRRIGIKSNIYNLAVEKTVEASVTNLVMLLVEYKNFKTPLVTLSEIQTRYAPSNDYRNGLNGMDNTKWFEGTSRHYYRMEAIYNELKGVE